MVEKISWDEYYYGVCKAVARNSKCFSRQIGAILVKDKSILCTGYNSPPRGVPTCDKRWIVDDVLSDLYQARGIKSTELIGKCPRQVMGFKSGEGLEWCVAGHAEENVILNAARMGICTNGAKMYMDCSIPCAKCWVKIINAGIEEIIVTSPKYYDKTSLYLQKSSTVKVRLFGFLRKD